MSGVENNKVESSEGFLSSQDDKQRLNVALTLILEVYRVIMGAFLLVFVPQKCGDDLCGMGEHLNNDSSLSKGIFSLNAITMFLFLFLYGVEVKREHKLIHYLEVNRTKPVDNESVGEELQKIEKSKIEKIWKLDSHYYYLGLGSSFIYLINTALSAYVISNKYYDSKTITVLLTNVLFMSSKVYDVYSICNTKKNVFYSAYLKSRVQFNDVDPDKNLDLTTDQSNLISNEDVKIESV